MKRTTLFATLTGALLVSATAFGISAAVDSPRSLMSPDDFGQARKAIEAETRIAVAACRDQDPQSRDLCFDAASGRVVYRAARKYMPQFDGLTAESVSLRSNRVTLKYSFK